RVLTTSLAAQQTVLACGDSTASSTASVDIHINTTGKFEFTDRRTNAGTAGSPLSASTLAASTIYTLAGVTRSQTDHRVFLNGVEDASDATSQTAGAAAWDRTSLGVLTRGGTNTVFLTGTLYWAAFWARGLANAEMLAMHLNPYAILARAQLGSRARARHYASLPSFPPSARDLERELGVEETNVTGR
ncbi:MAG: hypothetical protein ACRD2R_02045, partial [Terriglobales bacterium]